MRQVSILDLATSQKYEEIEDPYQLLEAIKNSDCTRCRRSEWRKENPNQKITIYRGNPLAKIWVIGKSPGVNDGMEGTPFNFGSGELLNKWIKYLGKDKDQDVFLINSVFCAADEDKAPTISEIRECNFYLKILIEKLSPKVLICLGMSAFEAISIEGSKSGLTMLDIAGMEKPIDSKFKIPAWVVFHPAYFFKGMPDTNNAKERTKLSLKAIKDYLSTNNI